MNENLDGKKYRSNTITNKDQTSSGAYGETITNIQKVKRTNGMNEGKYLGLLSSNLDIFKNITPVINEISNLFLRECLINFISTFTQVLSTIQTISNFLPPMDIQTEDDSIFLEWIFKDFRVGFTMAENETESMWFIITNRNLEEFSVTGDLVKRDYQLLITRILKYVLENT